MVVLDAVYSISQAWSSVNPVVLVRSRGKLHPGLKDDDMQGFPSEEISKSKTGHMVYAMKSFKNVSKDPTEEWLQSDACDLSFQHMADTGTVSAAVKQKGEGGKDESEGQNSECVTHAIELQYTDTSLE
jgi:hypothetical protein